MINIGDKLHLNDKNVYIVASKCEYESKNYFILVDENNYQNIKICYEKVENNSVVEVMDEQLHQRLLPLFAKTSEYILKNNEEQIKQLVEILKSENVQN